MKKHLVRVIALVILLPVAAYVGYLAVSSWNQFRVFQEFYQGATLTMQNIASIDIPQTGDHKAQMDEWNRKAAEKLQQFYNSYQNVRYKEITDSIEYTRVLLQDVFALRLNYADAIEPLSSDRMQDHQTVRDEDEYKWRTQILSGISRYLTTYEDNLNDSVDAFRGEVANSSWSEKYREYAWQKWGYGIKSQLVKMLPDVTETESQISKYHRFFAYMYQNRETYYVNQKGIFVFSSQRYLNDSMQVFDTMEKQWRTYGAVSTIH